MVKSVQLPGSLEKRPSKQEASNCAGAKDVLLSRGGGSVAHLFFLVEELEKKGMSLATRDVPRPFIKTDEASVYVGAIDVRQRGGGATFPPDDLKSYGEEQFVKGLFLTVHES
jgi:hypothetical protein